MSEWVMRCACHAVVAACITFLLLFHVVIREDHGVATPPAQSAVVASGWPPLLLVPWLRAPHPDPTSVVAAAARVARFEDAKPTKSLPSLPHPYVYAKWTLRVMQPPGGHYSTVLDRHVRSLARAFFEKEVRPLRDLQLISAVRQREVVPTLHATYYAAVMSNSAPALKAFGEYCGWSREGGNTSPAVPIPPPSPSSSPSADPAQATPVAPSPSAPPANPSLPPPGSEFAIDLRRLPDMSGMSAKLVGPVSLDPHAGEEGADVNAAGVVVPRDDGNEKKGHGPALAISLSVGLSVTAAVVVAGVALIIHRRRSDRYAPWLAASRRSSAATDADHGRRTSTLIEDGGGGGAGWHLPRWTLASFSLSPPARPPRVAEQAPTKAGGGGQERQHPPTGEKRVSWK
ncbi:hypothetical protein MMPV_001775 [Pyropia vietnamensis]